MCANNLSKVALDSAAVGIEPAISNRKSNASTTTPPSQDEPIHLDKCECLLSAVLFLVLLFP